MTSLIIVEANQLLDASTLASLTILLNGASKNPMLKMPGSEVRIVATKPIAIKTRVIAMLRVMGRTIFRPMLWISMISRGI